MRGCIEDKEMNVGRAFLSGLQKANRFEIKGGKLNFYEGGNLLPTFDAQVKN